MKLMDFFIQIGVKDDGAKKSLDDIDNSAQGAGRSFGKLNGAAMLAGAGILYLGAKLTESLGSIASFVDETAGALDELGDFAEANGTTAAAISQFGYAAQLSGSDIDAVKSTIAGLNQKIGEAAIGVGRGGKMFQKFGINVKDSSGKVKDTSKILEEIAGKMEGLSNQEAIAMASKLGIDASLVPLLLKGKDGIKALTDEAQRNGAVTNEQAAAAGAYADMMDKNKAKIEGVKNAVATALMPALADLGTKIADVTEKTADWLIKNDLLEPVIMVLGGTAIAAMAGALWLLLAPLVPLIAATWAFTAALLANPITWIVLAVVALIAGIVLLVQWISTNRAAFVAAYEAMKVAVAGFIAYFKGLWESARAWVVGKIEALKAAFWSFIGTLQSIDWLAPFRPMLDFLDMIWQKIQSIASFKMPSFSMPSWMGGSSTPTSSTAPSSGRGFSPLASNTINNHVTVNAGSNASPAQIARATTGGLSNARYG